MNTMRGVQVTLPPSATARHTGLGLARDAALDALRSTQQRLNDLPDDAEALLRTKLTAQRDLHALHNNTWHRLLSACNQWLFQLRLPPGYYLKPSSVSVTVPKGQTAAEMVDDVRREIAAIKNQELAVRRAPLNKQSQEQAAAGCLARLADRVRPKLNFDPHGNARATISGASGRRLSRPPGGPGAAEAELRSARQCQGAMGQRGFCNPRGCPGNDRVGPRAASASAAC
jgi:hypothetical protein